MENPTWFYVAQESEFPHIGDFKLLRIGKRSILIVRDEERRIRVLLNTCRHRSVPVCRQTRGNARTFICTFHGWIYNTKGALVGLQGPGRSVREFPEREGLLSVPRVENFQGSIYASLESHGESLEAYLGKEQERPGRVKNEDSRMND